MKLRVRGRPTTGRQLGLCRAKPRPSFALPARSSSSVLSLNVIAISQLPKQRRGSVLSPVSPAPGHHQALALSASASPSLPSPCLPAGHPAGPSIPVIPFPHLSQLKTFGGAHHEPPADIQAQLEQGQAWLLYPQGIAQGLVYSRPSVNAG